MRTSHSSTSSSTGMKSELLRLHPLVGAGKPGVGQAVPDLVACRGEVLADRLPGDRPVFAGLVIPQVDIVTRPVERHAVRSEAGDAVMFGGAVKRVAAGVLRDHGAQVPDAQVIRPGDRDIRPLDHVFAIFVIEITIAHGCLPQGSISIRKLRRGLSPSGDSGSRILFFFFCWKVLDRHRGN